MNFEIVFGQDLILLIIMIVGVIAGKTGIIADGASKKLSELLLYVTNPMLVLGSFFFEYSAEKLKNGLMVLLLATGFYFLSLLPSSILFRGFSEKVKRIMPFSAIFSNAAFIGLPMMKALYGPDGVFLGSFYIVAFNIFVWTFGYTMYGNAKESGGTLKMMKKALLNPAVIAVYAGVVIFVLRIPVPNVVKSAVSYIGDMTMPLSMLIIGALISTTRLRNLVNDVKVYYVSAVRLILMPLLAYGILYLLGVREIVTSVIVTALAMPVAATTTIFAELFDKDSIFASKAVMLSTILSIITAPLIVGLL